MKVSKQQWDEGYASGRWDFLSSADEQTRQACIAAFIASYTPGEVLDLGRGPGDLLGWIKQGSVTRYTGVDISEVALARIPDQSFPVERIVMSLSDFEPPAHDIATIVASEVLYFVDDPVHHKTDAADAEAICEVVLQKASSRRSNLPPIFRPTRLWSTLTDALSLRPACAEALA